MLAYNCGSFLTNVWYRVRAVQPAEVSRPGSKLNNDRKRYSVQRSSKVMESTSEEHIDNVENIDNGENISMSVMLSKPILALEFSCLKMKVEAPIVVSTCSTNS